MLIHKYRHSLLFYALSTVTSWLFWFAAAYLSHITPTQPAYTTAASVLGFIGLICPIIVVFFLVYRDKELSKDVLGRLFKVRSAKPVYLFLTCFLMLASILLAQAISLLFGGSVSQFELAGHFSFSSGIFPIWFLLLVAPIIEELAWHSYGTDSLRSRFNLLNTSLIFAVFWAIWHVPLSFIKDYYHSNLVETGLIYALNFPLSLIPFVVLMNWLYYKTGRSVLVAIVFHMTAGYFNEIFSTHPDSKLIQTVLLSILAICVVLTDKDFFLRKAYQD